MSDGLRPPTPAELARWEGQFNLGQLLGVNKWGWPCLAAGGAAGRKTWDEAEERARRLRAEDPELHALLSRAEQECGETAPADVVAELAERLAARRARAAARPAAPGKSTPTASPEECARRECARYGIPWPRLGDTEPARGYATQFERMLAEKEARFEASLSEEQRARRAEAHVDMQKQLAAVVRRLGGQGGPP